MMFAGPLHQDGRLVRLNAEGRMLFGRLVRNRGCCFIFHRATPSSQWSAMPNRDFYIDLDYLGGLISHLKASGWDIVTMDEALRRLARPGSRRFVNFSVDDCYRDTAEHVVPLFRHHKVPLTLYVTTGIPDRTLRLRNAGLETILQRSSSVRDAGEVFPLGQPHERRAAYATLSARWESGGGDAAYLRFCADHGFDPDSLDELHGISWPMLDAMRDDPYVEIGAHTVSHPHVSRLPPDAAWEELAESRMRLERALDRPVRHFAFPYGQAADCGLRDFALAKQAGYASAATTRKGLARVGIDPFQIPRNTLNGKHRHIAFAYAHLTGTSALAARVFRRG